MTEPREIRVELRYAAIGTVAGELGAIVIGYDSEESARDFYSDVHQYITAGGDDPRIFDIRFTANADRHTYEFLLTVASNDRFRTVKIENVDGSLVGNLRDSLLRLPYYVVLAGYSTNDGFELLDPREYHMFRHVVNIDGHDVTGARKTGVDWSAVSAQFR